MTAINTAETLSPALKAAATKGPNGHKAAGLRAQITRTERLRDALTGYDKGLATKRLNGLRRDLVSITGDTD